MPSRLAPACGGGSIKRLAHILEHQETYCSKWKGGQAVTFRGLLLGPQLLAVIPLTQRVRLRTKWAHGGHITCQQYRVLSHSLFFVEEVARAFYVCLIWQSVLLFVSTANAILMLLSDTPEPERAKTRAVSVTGSTLMREVHDQSLTHFCCASQYNLSSLHSR